MNVKTLIACAMAAAFIPTGATFANCLRLSQTPHAGVQQIEYDGRPYVVSIPKPCTKIRCGLVVDVHGANMSPDTENNITQLRSLGEDAQKLGATTPYVVIQPAALGHPARWTDTDPESVFKGVSCIADRLNLDPKRWHLGGFSLGAYLAAHIACEHPSVFASYGLIAGGADIVKSCMGKTRIALLYIHGVKDDIIPFVSAERLAKVARQFASIDGRVEELSAARTRYISTTLWIETIFHDGRSPALGPHCAPGASGPIGCSAGFDSGTELLQFYILHPQG